MLPGPLPLLSDKIKYIWSYYWIPIVGVVLAVIFAVSLISSIVKNNYDTVCFVAVLDGNMGWNNALLICNAFKI